MSELTPDEVLVLTFLTYILKPRKLNTLSSKLVKLLCSIPLLFFFVYSFLWFTMTVATAILFYYLKAFFGYKVLIDLCLSIDTVMIVLIYNSSCPFILSIKIFYDNSGVRKDYESVVVCQVFDGNRLRLDL